MDTKTHFFSRFVKLIVHMDRGPEDGVDEKRKASKEELRVAHKIATDAFAGGWENIPEDVAKALKRGP